MKHNDQTLALHAGHNTSETGGTRAVPIYQTTSYVFDNTDHAANLFSLAEPGYIYTRINNPTADILEQRLASLEGGIAASCNFIWICCISNYTFDSFKNRRSHCCFK